MTVKQMIKELQYYDPNAEVKICCYTPINDPDTMVIYDNIIDKNGNKLCQIHMDIINIGFEIDGKTVAIS